VAASRDLTADELLEIQAISLNYPYNFAEPPNPEIHLALVGFIANERFPFARADAFDKWEVQTVSAEALEHFLESNRVVEPGYLSALTTAKLIAFCLQIVEATNEALPELKGIAKPVGEDLMELMAELCSKTDEAGGLASPWKKFFLCTKNPVIRRGVNNAMINRWGVQAPGDSFSGFKFRF
jgi:hypothetical protein